MLLMKNHNWLEEIQHNKKYFIKTVIKILSITLIIRKNIYLFNY